MLQKSRYRFSIILWGFEEFNLFIREEKTGENIERVSWGERERQKKESEKETEGD